MGVPVGGIGLRLELLQVREGVKVGVHVRIPLVRVQTVGPLPLVIQAVAVGVDGLDVNLLNLTDSDIEGGYLGMGRIVDDQSDRVRSLLKGAVEGLVSRQETAYVRIPLLFQIEEAIEGFNMKSTGKRRLSRLHSSTPYSSTALPFHL